MSALMRLAAGGRVPPVTYVDDVFSAYTYTGNGSTQTITNGIDLAGKGGMVWSKRRDAAQNHGIFDTVNGVGVSLKSSSTAAHSATSPDITSFNSDGVTYGAPGTYIYNFNGGSYVNWTFRKAPKFFDVVTYTGDGTARNITHSLGVTPGMVIVKCTNNTSSWFIKHLSLPSDILRLESTAAKEADTGYFGSVNSSTFGVTGGATNILGYTYVAYLFAHDTGTDGIIQCGSFTTDVSGNATVALGWEPQFSLFKSSSGAGNWYLADSARGLTADGAMQYLNPNASAAEAAGSGFKVNATGFSVTGFGTSITHIYLAIRRPNKPPTVGTHVYNAIARTGTGAAATVTGVGFAPDLVMQKGRTNFNQYQADRLRGNLRWLSSSSTAVETTSIAARDITSFDMSGISVNNPYQTFINAATLSEVYWFFKRAPGVFDQVCYTGSGANKTEAHNLGVAPELWIIKDRSAANDWAVGCTALANTEYMALNATDAKATGATYWNSTYPTASVFSLGTMARVNTSTNKYVAYLFATKAGISKVGSYTGTATTNAIDCGFTTGARFVLIKRTDSTGDWYVWDTVRGIIAGNDPYLLLNTTGAEVTSTDYIDPYTSGFELSSTAPAAINASGGTYIYLAFA